MTCYATAGVVGWGGGWDDDVRCTCTHVTCYATAGVVGWGWGWDDDVRCTCTHVTCYATAGGRDGKVLLTPLPVILLAPGARPPTESNLDVSEFDLVNSIVNRNSMLFGGARAWRKAAQDAGLPYASVNHSLLEFSRQVHGLNQMPVTAGTQTLDRAWQDLKKYVPSEITAKDKKTKKINPALWDWIYSWMWRRNSQGDLWAAMAELFH